MTICEANKMNGMTYVDNKPFVWGVPAVWDDDPPLLECFSQ